MIHFEGEKTFARPAVEVFDKLTDASFLVGSLPEVEVTESTPDRSAWKMRPKFSFIRTTLENTLSILQRNPTTESKVQIVSSGIGASSTVEIIMQFSETDGQTKVTWKADIVGLTGLLKLVPKGLIQSSAGKVIEETWLAVDAKFASVSAN